jgi:hypothetical protein
MRTEYAMSSRSAVDEAAEWLSGIGCVAGPSDDRRGARLVVHHDEDMAAVVRRVVEMVDPAAGEASLVDARRPAFPR